MAAWGHADGSRKARLQAEIAWGSLEGVGDRLKAAQAFAMLALPSSGCWAATLPAWRLSR